jgi:hypothetical protein
MTGSHASALARASSLGLALTLACARVHDGGDELLDTGDDDPATCTPGRFGCDCDAQQTCAAGLECVAGVCELIDEAGETEGAPPSSCGWNPAAAWYDCGFRGVDPSGMHPATCPDDLVVGEVCPDTLPFEGCCDANGDVWYCEQDQVVHTPC